MFTLALHTHSRAYAGAPKPLWLGCWSGRTGQAAGVSWLDNLLPSEPRAWASQPRRSPAVAAGWTARAPACLHEVAARCHLTAINSSFHRRARQPPATQRVQPVVRLRHGGEPRRKHAQQHTARAGAGWQAHPSKLCCCPARRSRSRLRPRAQLAIIGLFGDAAARAPTCGT